MLRFLAGAAACFLLMTGAFLIWQSHAQHSPSIATDRAARAAGTSWFGAGDEPLQAPEASEKTKEEKRFSRADKNKDGKVAEEEMLEPRRKAFAKLDADHNGTLRSRSGRPRRLPSSRPPTRIGADGCLPRNMRRPHRSGSSTVPPAAAALLRRSLALAKPMITVTDLVPGNLSPTERRWH